MVVSIFVEKTLADGMPVGREISMDYGAYRRAALLWGVLVTDFAPEITFTGVVAARVRSDVSFRVAGKTSERLVDVGDHVTADHMLAGHPRAPKAVTPLRPIRERPFLSQPATLS